MTGRAAPRHETLSFWLLILGLLPGRIGAWSWTLWGAGSLGVAYQKVTDCRPTQQRDFSAVTPHFAITHFPFLLFGMYRLGRLNRVHR